MLKTILASGAGVMAAIFAVLAMETLGGQLFPHEVGFDPANAEHMKSFVASMSFFGKAWVVLGWIVAAAAGGYVGRWISPTPVPPYVVAAFLSLGTLANVIMIPHPLWMPIIGVAGVAAVAFWIARLPAPTPAPEGPPL